MIADPPGCRSGWRMGLAAGVGGAGACVGAAWGARVGGWAVGAGAAWAGAGALGAAVGFAAWTGAGATDAAVGFAAGAAVRGGAASAAGAARFGTAWVGRAGRPPVPSSTTLRDGRYTLVWRSVRTSAPSVTVRVFTTLNPSIAPSTARR